MFILVFRVYGLRLCIQFVKSDIYELDWIGSFMDWQLTEIFSLDYGLSSNLPNPIRKHPACHDVIEETRNEIKIRKHINQILFLVPH